MAITYHAGRRIQATQADFDGTPAVLGGWKELARTTLGSAGDTIDVSSLPDKRYYMILRDLQDTGGTIDHYIRMGNSTIDTGSNYAVRVSQNGGSDSTLTSQSSFYDFYARASYPKFSMGYLTNLSGKEKLYTGHIVEQNTAGAGNVPSRHEIVGKWANTSNPMDIHGSNNLSGSGSYASGSEVVVLGWDPADSHTTNFWELRASVDVTTGTSISTGNFTAKKYLWVQFYLDASAISFDWQFNSSTDTQTSTYSGRHSNNGAGPTATTDYTQINKNVMAENFGLNASPHFGNMFIVNNASKEKLVTGKLVNQNTATAGNIPNRAEFAYKWANTTNQINNITMLNSVNVSRFIMKVWGSN